MKTDNKNSNVGMQGGDNYGTVINNFNFKLPSFKKIKITLLVFLIFTLALYNYNTTDDVVVGVQDKGSSKNTPLIATQPEKVEVHSPIRKNNVPLGNEVQQQVIRNNDLKKTLDFSESVSKNSISQSTIESFLNDFTSKESFYDFLIVNLIDYRAILDEKNASQSLEVNFEIGVNYPVYEKKVAELESYFSKIGAILESKTDYPVLKSDSNMIFLSSSSHSADFVDNSFFIIKKAGSSYVRDTWVLPSNLEVKIPKIEVLTRIDDIFNNSVNIEILDKDKGIISAEKNKFTVFRVFPIDPQGGTYHFSNNSYWYHRVVGFASFLSDNRHVFYEKQTRKVKIPVKNSDLNIIHSINLEYKKQ